MTVAAFSATLTGSAVEEELLHGEADIATKLGRRARYLTARVRAGVGVVALSQRSHDGFALEVAGRALTRGAGQGHGAVATRFALVLVSTQWVRQRTDIPSGDVTSEGQFALVPSQVSSGSQTPVLARQTEPLEEN